MRRSLALLVLAAITLTVSECSSSTSPQRPVSSSAASAAFVYTGAWSASLDVELAPLGSATVWINKTTTLTIMAHGDGQTYRRVVGVGARAKVAIGKVSQCGCFTDVTIEKGLTVSPHIVTVINLSLRPLLIQSWTIDQGGVFLHAAAIDYAVAGTVAPGNPLSFYVVNTSVIAMDYVRSGAVLDTHLDDRKDGHGLVIHSASQSSRGLSRAMIAWGLPGSLEKVTINVVSGSLDIRDIVMFQAPGRGVPYVVPTDVAEGSPLLAVYGDTVGDGKVSLGDQSNADGFPERLAAIRKWRVADFSSDGASADCYGVANVRKVISASPSSVIVAFGMDDMILGPGSDGCDSTIEQFSIGMDSILSHLQEGLKGVPIYVQAILPSRKTPGIVLAGWNAALKTVADAHGVKFVNPGSRLSKLLDFASPYYPNTRGAQKIAEFWNTVLPPG